LLLSKRLDVVEDPIAANPARIVPASKIARLMRRRD